MNNNFCRSDENARRTRGEFSEICETKARWDRMTDRDSFGTSTQGGYVGPSDEHASIAGLVASSPSAPSSCAPLMNATIVQPPPADLSIPGAYRIIGIGGIGRDDTTIPIPTIRLMFLSSLKTDKEVGGIFCSSGITLSKPHIACVSGQTSYQMT